MSKLKTITITLEYSPMPGDIFNIQSTIPFKIKGEEEPVYGEDVEKGMRDYQCRWVEKQKEQKEEDTDNGS